MRPQPIGKLFGRTTDDLLEMHLVLALSPLIVLLSLAAVIDYRTRRIPNWLNATMLVAGVANAIIVGSPTSISGALLGLLVGFGLLIVPWLIGAMGGGDVKMLMAIGAWLGPVGTLQSYAACAIAAMLIAIVQAAMNGRLTRLISNSIWLTANVVYVGELGRDQLMAAGRATTEDPRLRSIAEPLPYAVPTLIGVGVTIAMNLV